MPSPSLPKTLILAVMLGVCTPTFAAECGGLLRVAIDPVTITAAERREACRGGIGRDRADCLGAMEAWVEEGVAPERITASRIGEGGVDMTRPLCPYPKVAVWDGKGNPNNEASFTCEAPAAQRAP